MTERVKSAIVADGRPPDLGSRISHADPRTAGAGSPDPASLGETAGFSDPALQPAPRKQRLLCSREHQPLDRLGALTRSTMLRVILSLSKDELVERAGGFGIGRPLAGARSYAPTKVSSRPTQNPFCGWGCIVMAQGDTEVISHRAPSAWPAARRSAVSY